MAQLEKPTESDYQGQLQQTDYQSMRQLLDKMEVRPKRMDLRYIYDRCQNNVPEPNYFVKQNGFTQNERAKIMKWFLDTQLAKRLNFEVVVRATQLLDLYMSKVPNALSSPQFNLSHFPPIYTLAGMCLGLAQKIVQQVPNLFMMFLLTFKTNKQTLARAELSILELFKYDVNLMTFVEVINCAVDELFPERCKNMTPHNSLQGSLSQSQTRGVSPCGERDVRERRWLRTTVTREGLKQKAVDVAFHHIQRNPSFLPLSHFDIGVLAVTLVLRRYRRADKLQLLREVLARQIDAYDFFYIAHLENQVLVSMGQDESIQWFARGKHCQIIDESGAEL